MESKAINTRQFPPLRTGLKYLFNKSIQSYLKGHCRILNMIHKLFQDIITTLAIGTLNWKLTTFSLWKLYYPLLAKLRATKSLYNFLS